MRPSVYTYVHITQVNKMSRWYCTCDYKIHLKTELSNEDETKRQKKKKKIGKLFLPANTSQYNMLHL